MLDFYNINLYEYLLDNFKTRKLKRNNFKPISFYIFSWKYVFKKCFLEIFKLISLGNPYC